MAQLAGPQITSIRPAQSNIVVTVEVPKGLRKVTLESRAQLNIGAWEPRAVQRLDGTGGRITFTLPAAGDVQMMRVRANERDPLPESFYSGSNSFENRVKLTQNFDANTALAMAPASASPQTSSLANSLPPGTLAFRPVSESDIWKVRGNTLYYFNHYRGLQVIDLSNADAPVIRGVFPLPAAGEQRRRSRRAGAIRARARGARLLICLLAALERGGSGRTEPHAWSAALGELLLLVERRKVLVQ